MTLLEGNLLEPLTFDDWGEISTFIRDNRCATCSGKLLTKHAPNRRWGLFCPKCGDVYQHSYIRKGTAERVEDSIRTGAVELRQGKRTGKTAEELINELTGGF